MQYSLAVPHLRVRLEIRQKVVTWIATHVVDRKTRSVDLLFPAHSTVEIAPVATVRNHNHVTRNARHTPHTTYTPVIITSDDPSFLVNRCELAI
jgi:hypothetical protein